MGSVSEAPKKIAQNVVKNPLESIATLGISPTVKGIGQSLVSAPNLPNPADVGNAQVQEIPSEKDLLMQDATRKRRGRASNILTGPLGLSNTGGIFRRTLQ